ncbi:VTT domain-containing protein [Psychromonas sp. MME2]|uniref:YqaA family protein n=1 Tax=unclassified Psychromonas TaxID=2614957 RepID=UPI00339BF98A
MIYYVKNAPQHAFGYLLAGSIGNTLGAVITYFMGYYFYWGRDKAQHKYIRLTAFCRRYGAPALLLSWLPVIGDLLPLIAGWFKLRIMPCLIFIFLGKALRYGIIIVSTLYFL